MLKFHNSGKFFAEARGRLLVSMIIGALLWCTCASFQNSAHAQKRRARRPPAATRVPTIDYSKFSHATRKHQGACNTCHKLPTENWKKAREFPDVADFPGHAACVSCHRPQFFKGARPAICANCHAKVSPKDDVR